MVSNRTQVHADLSIDRLTTRRRSHERRRLVENVAANLLVDTARLRQFVEDRHGGVLSTLLTAWAVLLSRCTERQEAHVAIEIRGDPQNESPPSILAIKLTVQLPAGAAVAGVLAKVGTDIAQAYGRQAAAAADSAILQCLEQPSVRLIFGQDLDENVPMPLELSFSAPVQPTLSVTLMGTLDPADIGVDARRMTARLSEILQGISAGAYQLVHDLPWLAPT